MDAQDHVTVLPETPPQSETELMNGSDGVPSTLAPTNTLQGTQWVLALLMEPLLAFVLLWEDYDEKPWYTFVAHYYTWFFITNTIAVWVAPSKRGFWPPFRFVASIQIMLLIGNLVLRNIEDICDPMTIARFAVLLVYMVHNLYLCYQFAPSISDAVTLLTELTQTKSIAAGWLTVFFLTILASNLLVSAHYRWGYDALEAPVTSYQATQGFTGSLKAVILDHCIVGLKRKCRVQIPVLLMFVVQWCIVPELFFKAPIPYLHMLAEFLVFYDVMRMYILPESWRKSVELETKMGDGILTTTTIEQEEI